MRRSARTAVFATAAVATSAALARAEHTSLALRYTSAKSATSCPDENTFRGLVAARLGYDPFVSAGVRTLTVDFERRGSLVVGRLDLEPDGDSMAVKRTLRTDANDCFELATSMALVVAVAVDPNAGSAPRPAPREEPEPPPVPSQAPSSETLATPAPAPAEADRPVRPQRSGHRLRFELGGFLTWGVVPDLAPAARGGVGLDFGTWSVRAEGAFVSAGSRENTAGRGEVSAFALAGSLVPCVDPIDAESFGLELCAVGSVGALRSTAKGVTRAAPTSTLLASLGPRVATIVMLSHVVGVGVAAEAPVALVRARLHIEDAGTRNEVWVEPPFGFIFGASFLASIP